MPNSTQDKSVQSITEEEISTALETIVINSESGHTDPRYFDRYLVTWSFEGKQQVQEVPTDACVMSMPQILKAINEPNGMMVDTDTLASFAIATINRLKQRHAYHLEQNNIEALEQSTKAAQAIAKAVQL